MNKPTTKIFILLLITVFLMVGCSLVEVNQDKDGQRVIATVNGEKILKKEYLQYYNYEYYYRITANQVDVNTAAGQKALKDVEDNCFKQLIEKKIFEIKAKEAGFLNYSDEEKTKAKEDVDKQKKEQVDSYISQMKDTLANDPQKDTFDYEKAANEKYEETLKNAGVTYEQLLEEQLMSNGMTRYQDSLLADVTVADVDIVNKWNELKGEQIQNYSKDVTKFENDYSSGATIYSYPEVGYRKILNLLVKFDQDSITNLQKLYTEYNSETDETKKAEKLAAYNAALTTAKASIQPKVDEITAKITNDNFDALIVEYGEDDGMKTEELRKAGYIVSSKTTNFIQEFSDAALAISKPGEVSPPTATYFGYHIIKYVEDLPKGDVDFSKVKDDIKEDLLEINKNTKWTEIIEGWKTEVKIKENRNAVK